MKPAGFGKYLVVHLELSDQNLMKISKKVAYRKMKFIYNNAVLNEIRPQEPQLRIFDKLEKWGCMCLLKNPKIWAATKQKPKFWCLPTRMFSS